MKARNKDMAKGNKPKKDKKDRLSSYKAGTLIIDIIILFLGLIFFIGFFSGSSKEIVEGFVRVVGGVLTALFVFELINFLRIKDKTVFDWVVLIIAAVIGITGVSLIIWPAILVGILKFIFAAIIVVYAIVVMFTAVMILRPSGSKYWWFSLLFGLAALVLAVVILLVGEDILVLLIGISLVVGAVGGIANAILASQAKKEMKANSKILEDASYTVDSTKTEDEAKPSDDDNVNF